MTKKIKVVQEKILCQFCGGDFLEEVFCKCDRYQERPFRISLYGINIPMTYMEVTQYFRSKENEAKN